MGGYGSGRRQSRALLGDLLKLSLATFTRSKALHPGAVSSGRIEWENGNSLGYEKADGTLTLRYSIGDESCEERIWLVYLPRHFGGSLVVAICPRCHGNARVLYFSRRRFVCHRCTAAIYFTKRTDAAGRALRRFRKLRERIRPGTWNADGSYFPRRPKRMRRATYARIKEEALDAFWCHEEIQAAGLLRVLRRIDPKVLASILN